MVLLWRLHECLSSGCDWRAEWQDGPLNGPLSQSNGCDWTAEICKRNNTPIRAALSFSTRRWVSLDRAMWSRIKLDFAMGMRCQNSPTSTVSINRIGYFYHLYIRNQGEKVQLKRDNKKFYFAILKICVITC